MKKSFVLYLDQYEPIKNLTIEQKGKLFDAMFLYNCGEEINLNDPLLEMAFSFFKQTFDRDTQKWLRKAEKNRENGKKGGRPKNNNNSGLAETHNNPENPDGCLETHGNPDEPKKAVSGSVSSNVNANDILSEFEIFWERYDKKEDRKKCFTKWKNLKVKDKELIFKTVSDYVASTQDKKYRKNPYTWLNGECWNNEAENKQVSSTDISTESWF